MWVYDIVNRQGVQLARVRPSSGSWTTRMNGYGQGSHTFLPADTSQGLTAAEWREFTRPGGDRVLVVSRMKAGIDAPLAVYAGLIDDQEFDYDSGRLTVQHKELRWILQDRFALQVPTFNRASVYTIAGKSLRGAARAVIAKGLISTLGDNWHFPVVLPADQSGTVEKSWPVNKFVSLEDMLAEVCKMDGGPDIAFDPVWTSGGRLEWWARIGSPRISAGVFEWSASAADTPVRGLREQLDSSRQKSGVFAPGDGSGEDRPVGTAGGIAGSGMPDRDAVVSFSQVEKETELNSLALANLKAHREPTLRTTFSLHAPDTDLGDQFRLGSQTRIWVEGSVFLSDGWREGYVVALSGDMGSLVGVEALP